MCSSDNIGTLIKTKNLCMSTVIFLVHPLIAQHRESFTAFPFYFENEKKEATQKCLENEKIKPPVPWQNNVSAFATSKRLI